MIIQKFEQQVEALPDRVAIKVGDVQLTYDMFNRCGNRIAHHIKSWDERHGTDENRHIVALLFQHGIQMVTSVVAALKAEKIYVPLDVSYPVNRLEYMLQHSEACMILTNNENLALAEELNRLGDGRFDVVNIDAIAAETASGNLERTPSGERPAYILYTSGSTGRPKGVLQNNTNVMYYTDNWTERFEITSADRMTLFSAFSHDGSVQDMFGALLNGATLYPKNIKEIADTGELSLWVLRERITIWHSVPTLFRYFVGSLEAIGKPVFPLLRYILLGGEALRENDIGLFNDCFPGAVLANVYGQTESSVSCIWKIKGGEPFSKVLIGEPLSDTEILVVDEEGEVLEDMGVGELLVGCEHIALGYWRNDEATESVFLEDEESGRLYCTGDLGRLRADGSIECLGRKDGQVKIRGFRVEPGEIETQLLKHKSIKEAVVMIREDDIGEKHLCAYFVTVSVENGGPGSDDAPSSKELRDFLGAEVPEYMVPTYFILLDKMPLTPTNKIDRKALPEPEITTGTEHMAPRDDVEEELAKLWSDVLAIDAERVSINSSYFELGGHSLNASVMLSKIHKDFHVKVPLVELFKEPTIEGLAGYIKGAAKSRFQSIPKAPVKPYYRLSSAQRRLYILQQMQLDGTGYNMPRAMTLEGEMDLIAFERAFRQLIKRHESLRTSFYMEGDEPVQRITEDVPFEVEYFDLTGEGGEAVDRVVNGFIRPFDLAQAPLLRVGVVIEKGERHVLLIDMHHIITDGISQQILINDFMALFNGRELRELKVQYNDYVQWFMGLPDTDSGSLKNQESYWLKEFDGEIPVLELPLDFPRPSMQSFEGGLVSFWLEDETFRGLKALASAEEGTPYMVLVALFNVLLARLSGSDSVVMGTPVAGRRHAEIQDTMGMFVNTLALKNEPLRDKTFRNFLREVKRKTLEAFANQEYPFEELVEKAMANIRRDTSRSPLFDVMFILQNMELAEAEFTGMKLTPYKFKNRISRFDLTVSGVEMGDRLAFTMEYCIKLFKEETVERFGAYFKRLISSAVTGPDSRICDLEMIAPEERDQLLFTFNATAVEFEGDKCIHQLLEEQAARTPELGAITGRGEGETGEWYSLSYKELNQRADSLAVTLRKRGLKADQLVGVMIERSIDMMAALLAVLKAGGAYVPLDPDYPADRVAYILEHSGASLILAQRDLVEQKELNIDGSGTEWLFIDDESVWATATGETVSTDVNAGNLAYVIYTSGSTGRPKGVMIEHRPFSNFIKGITDVIPFGKDDCILSLTTISFDIFGLETFLPLCCGSRVVMGTFEEQVNGDAAAAVMADESVTHLQLTPSRLTLLLASDEARRGLGELNYLMVGGEAFPPKLLDEAREVVRGKIYNMYGPTETTVWSCIKDVSAGEVLNIGKPIANTQVYILGKGDTLQPVNVAGELCIGGSGLGRGYFASPELTEKKFIPMPENLIRALIDRKVQSPERGQEANNGSLSDKPPLSPKAAHIGGPGGAAPLPAGRPLGEPPEASEWGKIYRTGDLARWLPEGNLEFLGRMDFQVKVRGFRIELGEIESVLVSHEEIKEAVVTAREDASGGSYLCAYVIPEGAAEDNDEEISLPAGGVAGLNEFLSNGLPDYMIPTYFTPLAAFPLTPNGKIDRRALPEPEAVSTDVYVAPRDEVEEKLVSIWRDVLNMENGETLVGIDDNFFQLGGHSLRATVMASRVHKELAVKVPLGEIFKHPTIRGLSGFIKGAEGERYEKIEPAEIKPYYPMSSAQRRLYILQEMEPGTIGYNMPQRMHLDGDLDKDCLERSFKELVARHEGLRTSFLMKDETPVQRVHDRVPFEIEYFEIGADGAKSWEGIYAGFVRPFDLSQAPLLRVGLIESGDENPLLLLDMHHIITDGTSQAILTGEFNALYNGEKLPPLRLQYKDFSEWQNSPGQKERLARQGTYWKEVFSGDVPVLNLPYDFPRPLMQRFEGGTIGFRLGAAETGKLRELARVEGGTLFMCLLSIFNILLARLSGQEDIVVGTPIAARRHADLENVIGMMVNTLALRAYPAAEKKTRDFVQEVKQFTLEAFENQEYPFEDLVEGVSIQWDTGRNPLFDAMFDLQNQAQWTQSKGRDSETAEESEAADTVGYTFEEGISRFDIHLTGVESGNGLYFALRYCSKLFKRETMASFAGYFKRLVLEAASEAGEGRICDLDMLEADEKEQLVRTFNTTDVEFAADKCIHQLLEEQAARTPELGAITGRGEGETGEWYSLSYKELNQRADSLAVTLRKRGLKADQLVGVMVERSIDMMAALLAVLKAGGAYVPLDPDYPADRVAYILEHSGASLILAQRELVKQKELNIDGSGTEWLFIDDESVWATDTGETVSTDVNAGNLAYVIYTSGSTGRPKGVMIEHRPFSNFIKGITDVIPFGKDDCILSLTTISFDIFGLETFLPLCCGSRVVMGTFEEQVNGDAAAAVMADESVTHLQLTPSRLTLLLASDEARRGLGELNYLMVGGEAFPPKLLDEAREVVRGKIYNMYGPTETTVWSCIKDVSAGEVLNIGKPIANTQVYILGKGDTLQPVNVAGELCIGGSGLGRGYFASPELTEKKFIPMPENLIRALIDRKVQSPERGQEANNGSVSDKPPLSPKAAHIGGPGGAAPLPAGRPLGEPPEASEWGKIYRTGDLARWLPEGNLEFLGRMDFQVKVRGFRIELGEIESVLVSHEEIKEAVVTAREDASGGSYLCAYVIPEGAAEDNDEEISLPAGGVAGLNEFLSNGLPDYMIPTYFTPLAAFPLTPNGKIDRRALPEPEAVSTDVYVAPRDRVEEALASIWRDVLNLDEAKRPVGIDDNFFQLGGHSLRATVMASRVYKKLGARIPLGEIFRNPTLKGIAGYIKGVEKDAEVMVTAAEKKEYYVLSATQKQLYFFQQLDEENISYHMPLVVPVGKDIDREKLEWVFRQLVARHESLRTSFELVGDEPVQRVHADVSIQLEYSEATDDSNGVNEEATGTSLDRRVKNFIRPFDLSKAPLIRVGVIERKSGSSYLVLDIHHIITDGISQEILTQEFKTLYNGGTLPPLRIQYKDYCQWRHVQKQSEILAQQESYWLKQFESGAPVIALPTDYPRPDLRSNEGDRIRFTMDSEALTLLRKVASEKNVTLFMTMFAVFNVFLAKICGQEDFVVGTGVAGRRYPDLENMVGILVNVLALRSRPVGGLIFSEYLEEVKAVLLDAFDNQDYAFEDLVGRLDAGTDMSRNPFFDVGFMLVMEDKDAADKRPGGEDADERYMYENRTAKYDLVLNMTVWRNRIYGNLEFATKLFKTETIETFVGYILDICRQVTTNPETRIENIEISHGLLEPELDMMKDADGDFGF